MFRWLYTLWDTGIRLRCPVCEQGRLFEGWFTMLPTCAHCSVRFERHEGEVVGGMALSISLTSLIFLVGFLVTETVLDWPTWLQLVLWVSFAVAFPILFYRYSRALWVAFLYLTGDVFWDREPYVDSTLSILDAFRPPADPSAPQGEDDPPPPLP